MKFVLEIDLDADIAEFGETQNDSIARILRNQAAWVADIPHNKTVLVQILDTKGEHAGFWQIKN